MTDRVGQQLGNYRLIRLLGRGGFAEVYLGEHQRLKTHSAIKVLYTQLGDDDVDSFLKEARIIAHLEHPNIVRVFDFDVEEGTPFLVMSYAPNGNLRQLYAKGMVLPPNTIISYVKQVTSALQYAHDEKLIHRDIKPENMLLGRHNDILLSDFGIALATQSSRLHSTQEVIGTAAYMAPEQFQGKPRRASDQYALGIIVYEWLCGERPFNGNFTELFSQHLFVPPPSLGKKVPSIPPEVEQVVLTALAKNPEERFSNVRDFARALEQAYQSSQPPQSRPITLPSVMPLPSQHSSLTKKADPSPASQLSRSTNVNTPQNLSPQPTVKATPFHTSVISSNLNSKLETASSRMSGPPQRHLTRRAVILGLVGTVAGGGIIWIVRSKSLSGQKIQVVSTPRNPSPILTTYRGHSKSVNSVAWSFDGKRIASGSDDLTVQVWDAATGNHVFTYHGHIGIVTAVVWSPDSRLIASGSNDNTAHVWDATTGGNIFTFLADAYFTVNTVSWSFDGKYIAFGDSPIAINGNGGQDNRVRVWDATTGNSVFTYHGHSAAVTNVAWSPHEQRIASASDDTTVQVWDATTGENVFTYHGHSDMVTAVAWSPDGKRIASCGYDKTVQVWDATTGSNVLTYSHHSDVVYTVAWSSDGKYIASGSVDKTAQVWDAATGNHVYTFRGHSNIVTSVVWAPNRKQIASGSADKTVQVWQPL